VVKIESGMLAASHVWHWLKCGGRPAPARLSRWRSLARKIVDRSERLAAVSDAELTRRAQELRWQARSGTPLARLLPQAYALVREAARRTLGKQHYIVQLMGGIALFEGGLAEMQTGEGKTLTATLPVFLRALVGRGCHVITVNDYLAQRDARELRPLYALLGMTVACILSDDPPEQRRAAYRADITYTTGREVGFDFLRDRLQQTVGSAETDGPAVFDDDTPAADSGVQRGLYFALIDEADSVLIDDAGTPMIIALEDSQTKSAQDLYAWSRQSALRLTPREDYFFDWTHRTAELTNGGCRKVLLWPKPPTLNAVDAEKFYHHVEQALRAELGFLRGRDYVVQDGEISIVDESTGRVLEGRKWQDGLHQAVETKEGVTLSAETGDAARITVQTFFRRYEHLAGMSGTAVAASREFRRTYRLHVTAIPTHRRARRIQRPPKIFPTLDAKNAALGQEIQRLQTAGHAVLVGTPSVEASERLGQVLSELQVSHRILNALQHAVEAEIVAEAGQPHRVTIATNMAGRGTDIVLHDDVRQRGGLYVLATEIHSSRRIDRQLIGRCARQGDPGVYQFWLSLEDELFRDVPAALHREWKQAAVPNRRGELPRRWFRVFRRVQRQIESRQRRLRRQLLRQDQEREKTWRAMGLDPYLELTE
jgi:preprotein translocase subunit SecA